MAPKRTFYQDDEVTVTEPGLNEQISSELESKESILQGKDVSILNGMTIRAPELVNKFLKQVRLYLYEKLVLAENEFSTTKTLIQNELLLVNLKYHELVQEPVLPGLIYILTGALTGSIMVRNRVLPTRFFTPLIFGGVVYLYAMPKTFEKTTQVLVLYEKEFPQVYETHQELNKQTSQFFQDLSSKRDELNGELIQSVAKARKYLKDLTDK